MASGLVPYSRPFPAQRWGAGVALVMAKWLLSAHMVSAEAPAKLDYNNHIRPILAENCFKCHGADEKQRKGKLRLDVRSEALAKKAIMPGKPDESEAIKRLITTDEDEVMPPPKEHRKISDTDRALLTRWINEGAEYKNHWAFIPPVKPAVPEISDSKFSIYNPIDAFILAKLNDLKLSPAAAATKEQWLRRVTFALTGLPPTLEEMNAFFADESPQGREQVVDRLLNSTAYGEHLAKDWLDAARYADSYGRHEDGDMIVWPWRDWVIKSYNDNLPFDQFIIHQSAGDLLPNPTRDQLVATAFNRLALQSNESGNDPEEFRLDQVSDRVRANGLAFMGLSIECAKCHDHKYDPISQKEYWQMAAFFDNIDENGVYSQFCPQAIPSPSLLLPDAEQQRSMEELNGQIALKEAELKKIYAASHDEFEKYIASNRLPGEYEEGSWNRVKSWFGGGSKVEWKDGALAHLDFEKDSLHDREMTNLAQKTKPAKLRHRLDAVKNGPVGGAIVFSGDDEIELPKMASFNETDDFSFAVWLRPHEHRERAVIIANSRGGVDDGRGYEVIMENEIVTFALMHFVPGNEIRIRAKNPLPLNEWTHLAFTYDGSSRAAGLKMYHNGTLLDTVVVHDHLIKDISRRKEWGDIDLDQIRVTLGGREHDSPLKNCDADEFWVFDHDITSGEVKLLANQTPARDDWYEWFVQRMGSAKGIEKQLTALRRQRTTVFNQVFEMMVMKELPQHRPCFVHPRGNPKQHGDPVEPSTPEHVLPFPMDATRDRLGFAQWLVSRGHPLTARVAVNRLWQLVFARGLVSTPQDFGTRGELPTHPELLDWLACDFMDNGWNVKRLLRQIVLSSAFAQSATPSDSATLTSDPENRLIARGPFTRLSAEELRDQALAASGLLCPKSGGPAVRPYMPAGLYLDSGLQQNYAQDHGENLYRRSIYSFKRRTLPPPELAAFDGPSGEFCVVKREKTNTPMQALVLLNNAQFVEAQRVLGESLVKKFPADDRGRCANAFRLLTSRNPADAEIAAMCQLLNAQREIFKADTQAAAALLKNGEHPADAAVSPVEIAATAMLVRALMSHVETNHR